MKNKENLFVLITCGVMLVAALFLNWMEAFHTGVGLMKMGEMKTMMRVCSILIPLAPIIVALYVYQDLPQLASLKKYLSYDKRIVYALPIICLLMFYVVFSTDKDVKAFHVELAIGFTFYLIAAVIVFGLPFVDQKCSESDSPKDEDSKPLET